MLGPAIEILREGGPLVIGFTASVLWGRRGATKPAWLGGLPAALAIGILYSALVGENRGDLPPGRAGRAFRFLIAGLGVWLGLVQGLASRLRSGR
jgi:hypothetical protein